MGVEKIIVHSQYASKYIRETRSYTEIFDIALLKLDVAVNLFHYTPACLPGRNLNVAGETAWVYGWGMHEQGQNKPISNILRETTVKVISAQECKQKQHWEHVGLLPSHLCAWTVGQDSCRGDSGGPLFFLFFSFFSYSFFFWWTSDLRARWKAYPHWRGQLWGGKLRHGKNIIQNSASSVHIVCFRPSRQAFTLTCPTSELG